MSELEKEEKKRPTLRTTPYVKSVIKSACSITGQEPTSFMIEAALEKAHGIIKRHDEHYQDSPFALTEKKPCDLKINFDDYNKTEVKGFHFKHVDNKNLNLTSRYVPRTKNYGLCVLNKEYHCDDALMCLEKINLSAVNTDIVYLLFKNPCNDLIVFSRPNFKDNSEMLTILRSYSGAYAYKGLYYFIQEYSKNYTFTLDEEYVGFIVISKNAFNITESITPKLVFETYYSAEDERSYVYCADRQLVLSALMDEHARIGKNITNQFHSYLLVSTNNSEKLLQIPMNNLDQSKLMFFIENQYDVLGCARNENNDGVFYNRLFESISVVAKNYIGDDDKYIGYFIVSKAHLPGMQKSDKTKLTRKNADV